MSDFKLKTRKLENENIRQTLAGCFVLFLLFAFLLVASSLVSFSLNVLLTFVTHNSYLFCFFNNRVVHFVFLSFVNENDDENEMNFLFVCFCMCLCVVKKGGTITTRQRNGVLFVLVSVLLLSICFFFSC